MRVIGLMACLVVASCGDNIHPASEDPTPARIATAIAPSPLTAGNTATATCTVYNAAGTELVDLAPTLVMTPPDPGTTISGLDTTITKAGHYAAQCVLPGLAGDFAQLEVVHALPAKLVIGKAPDQQVYGIDVAVTITHTVTDRYGNPVDDAVVTATSTPITGLGPTSVLSPDSFSYGGEGKYRVDGQVEPPTDAMLPVTDTLDLVVNQSGPAITCGSPVDGTMLNLAPGSQLMFNGSAVDVNGTMAVTVNGTAVTPAMDGSFSQAVTSRFGINFIDVVATDTYGVETTKVCTFLVANQWASGVGGLYGDTISLRLAQAAIDDGNRSGAIDSLGDMLYAVANSSGLRTQLDSALAAANPLEPSTCNQNVCVPLIGCACVLSSEVDYNSSQITGPNSDGLTLVNNGLGTQAQVNNITLNLRIHGSAAGIGYDTTGDVDISFISVQLVLDTGLAAGKPHISVRAGSVSTGVGSISTNFSGISGFLINNIIVPLAQGFLRNTVQNQVQSFITNNFNGVLDGVVSGLDISTLGTSFNVPRLDGGNVTLGFGIDFSSLGTTGTRMLFGIGTKFTAPSANGYASLGVPIPTGTVLSDPAVGTPAAIAAHVGIFNQALHALWKANFFAATIDAATLNSSATGITLGVTTRLPPVATFNGSNQVELSLGDVDVQVSGPNIPPGLNAITLGARAHTSVTLLGNALVFGGIVVDEVHLTSDSLTLSAMAQMQVEDLLKGLAQHLADTSLNGALPALPIPSFTIPASLTTYGIPMGQLGIDNPSLSLAPPHFRLGGGFAIH